MTVKNLAMQLPVQSDTFGGVVGSRIVFISESRAVVQVAYLEKGDTVRVRFVEQLMESFLDGPGKLANIKAGEGADNKIILEMEFVSEGEKQSPVPNG